MITMQRVNKANPIWEIRRNDLLLCARRSAAAALKNWVKIRALFPNDQTHINEQLPRT